MPTAPPRESLSQLSDLLEKGEKTGLFSSRNSSQMPSTIEQGIQEENLRFLLRRDDDSNAFHERPDELNLAPRPRLVEEEGVAEEAAVAP